MDLFYPEAISHPIFKKLSQTAQETGLEAYVVGGFVRNFFLKKESKDIDVVIVGSGVQFAKAFASLIDAKEVVVYENFGTALVKTDDLEIEFVGARKESYQRDSRKPIVENGSLQDDQIRRDFTINAMSFSLKPSEFAKLIDPFNGMTDLENKIIRTAAEPLVTFSDDPLRMMRAIRFATTLGFRIHEDTYTGIVQNIHRISIISKERITEELNKIIMAQLPSLGFKLLFNTGLLKLIFPEMCALHGVEVRNGKAHKDNFYHTLQVLDNLCLSSDNLWTRWAAILHDIAKPPTKKFNEKVGWTFHGHEDLGARMVPRIFKELRLPLNEKMKFVQKLVKLHLRPIALVDEEVTDAAIRRLIVDAGEDLEELLKLCRSDITTRDAKKVERYLKNYDRVQEKIKEVLERDNLRNWQPPITGEIIMEMFNLAPGPEIGVLKNAVRNAILDGDIPNTAEDAKLFIIQLAKEKLNLTPVI